jgi:membrane protein
MEHQTVRDTTVGDDKPLGKRAAWVADTKGEAQD